MRSCSAGPVLRRSPSFFFNDTATTEIYTLSLHDALPISCKAPTFTRNPSPLTCTTARSRRSEEHTSELQSPCNLVCRLLLEKKQYRSPELRRANERGSLSHGKRRNRVGRVSVAGWRCVLRGVEQRSHNDRMFFFFFNDTATTEIYTLSLHDALPISLSFLIRPWSLLILSTLKILM